MVASKPKMARGDNCFYCFMIALYFVAASFALPIESAPLTTEATDAGTIAFTNISQAQNNVPVLAPIHKVNKAQSELVKSIAKKSAEEIQDVLLDTNDSGRVRISRASKLENGKLQRRRNYLSPYPKYYEEAEWPALI